LFEGEPVFEIFIGVYLVRLKGEIERFEITKFGKKDDYGSNN